MKGTPDTISVTDLLDLRSHQMLTVNPEYQRGAVWKIPQKKRLIDSVLRGYPLPLMYLHHIKRTVGPMQSERFEVIDGQQRLNAMHEYREGAFPLFHPIEDESEARFPDFVKNQPCPWGGKRFEELPDDLKDRFLTTPLAVVKIEASHPSEARDLFVRLQAGMPLNAQEKRDAWPGDFTEFVLKLGGKPEIAKYPGHDFFVEIMKARKTADRGKYRQLAAQIAMLFLTRRRTAAERLCDVNAEAMDEFYYQNIDFDVTDSDAKRFTQILDKLTSLLRDQKRKKLQGHEAIHLVLLIDALWDDYTRSWEASLPDAFDRFREQFALAVKAKWDVPTTDYWLQYGVLTRSNSDRADTIERRHRFFAEKMVKFLRPTPKDPNRAYGSVEREIIYYRDRKQCQVCKADVVWQEAQIHHVKRHADGGQTELENGALVHKHCHPMGEAAEERFAQEWTGRRSQE